MTTSALSRLGYRAFLVAAVAVFPIIWALALPYNAIDYYARSEHLRDLESFVESIRDGSLWQAFRTGERL